jgi:hypothetical protein
MQTVQKITVDNKAGFDLSFHVEDSSGKTYGSETKGYPAGQSVTVDLGEDNVPEGTSVHPVISAHVGSTHTASGAYVTYQSNQDNATYVVTGGYLDIHVDLLGS